MTFMLGAMGSSAGAGSPFGGGALGGDGGFGSLLSFLGQGATGGGTQAGGASSAGDSRPAGGSGSGAPSVQEFQDAATSADMPAGQAGDLKPLMKDGKPVERTDPETGMVGKAYVTPDDKVIVAYGGTGSGSFQDPGILGSQLQADGIAAGGGVAPAQEDAASFAREVQGIAKDQGYSPDDVFVSGHSLGGMEAQYAAQQTGMGGMAFETPGIRPDPSAPGDGSNFVTVSDRSDPIADLTFGGPHYGQELDVNTGLGPMAHIPGAQSGVLGSTEGLSLDDLLRQLRGG